MNVAAACIENKQALRSEDARVEIGKGLSEGAARLISSGKCIGRVGWTEQCLGLLDQRSDSSVEDKTAYGTSGGVLIGLRVLKFLERAAGGEEDVIDFSEVVIFAG